MKAAGDARLTAALDDFEWRDWSGDAVIYHATSGDTYLIRNPAGSILRQFEVGVSWSEGDLLDHCNSNQPVKEEDFKEVLSLMLDVGILTQS